MRALMMSRNSRTLILIEEYEINGVKRFKFKDEKTGIIINVSGRDVEDAKKRAFQVASLIFGFEVDNFANTSNGN